MSAGKAAGLLIDIPDAPLAGYIGGGIRNVLKWRRANPLPLSETERYQIALISWNTIAAPAHALDIKSMAALELETG